MKRLIVICFLLSAVHLRAQDPVTVIIQQGIKKLIVAIDLKIQRLQNETIWLQNAQKTIENELSRLKLTEIADWVEKQRKLYSDYFDELWKVKTTISYYHKISEIVEKQKTLVREFKKAFTQFRSDPNFTPQEIDYMYKVYTGILKESAKNLDAVFLVVKAFATQMTDESRMEIIDRAALATEQTLSHLRQFTSSNQRTSLQRAIEKKELQKFKKIYGL